MADTYPLCILDAKPILPWQSYKVLGEDLPTNHIRAHEECVVRNADRWLELRRQLGIAD